MKRCPSCQRTFPDDAPDYCPNDGLRLVNEEAAAFDPERTVTASGMRLENVAAQESPATVGPQTQNSAPAPAMQQPVQPQPATAWASQAQQPAQAPYAVPGIQLPAGVRKAFAIGSLAFGAGVAAVMAVLITRNQNFAYILLLTLSSLAILLALAALFVALKSPARFGGIELAIVGLALGVAGLVYFLLNQS